MTSSFNLLKFSFSSSHNPVRTTQDLLEYIYNSSVFAVSCSWRTDVTWLSDASPLSSTITRSSNLTIRAGNSSIVTCYCWFITSEAARFLLLSGASASATSAFLASLTVAETLLASFFCCQVVVWFAFDFPFFLWAFV